MFKVEKNIPIPARSFRSKGRTSRYPFRQMSVGDSFAIPVVNAKKRPKVQSRVSAAAVYFGRQMNAKFATRLMPNAIRVWRTA